MFPSSGGVRLRSGTTMPADQLLQATRWARSWAGELLIPGGVLLGEYGGARWLRGAPGSGGARVGRRGAPGPGWRGE